MDPVSHGLLGAGWTIARRKSRETLLLCGAVGGVAALVPDLDLLIASPSNPLLVIEYHRGFTHSLAFSAVFGVVLALAWSRWVGGKLSLRTLLALSWLGLLTHVLLDACTTYGTELLWPFSPRRFALNAIPVVDPLFTGPMAVLVILSLRRRQSRFAYAAAAWAFVYIGIGLVQHERALAAGERLAHSRAHEPARVVAVPTLGNLLLWKSIYEAGDRYYVDAVRAGITPAAYDGESIASLDVPSAFPALDPGSTQARDIERFRQLADGLVAIDPEHPERLIDLRYSLVPNEISSFWAITIDPLAPTSQHVGYVRTRERAPEEAVRLIRMVFSRP